MSSKKSDSVLMTPVVRQQHKSGRLSGLGVFPVIAILLLLGTGARAATRTAASASLADVRAAVNAANDGDTVLIPNGSATWSGGIATTKQIIIRAQNYTPTPAGTRGAGATSRSVTLTNNSGDPLFEFTSGNSYHCGVGGIRFNEGSGSGAHIALTGSGTKVPLIFDCYFQNRSRNWPAQQAITVGCRGGVMWNCVMEGTQNIAQVGEGSLLVKLPNGIRNWETASTMGALDTNGDWNFYVEDSTFKNVGACPDIDDHGRFVARHFVYDGTWGATHGFTSLRGGRHWEYYDGVFKTTSDGRNISGRYFWCRAGTGLFTDNEVQNAADPTDYGAPAQLDIGDNTAPSGYPQERAPGRGHNGTSHVSDPIYIWKQTGARAYDWGHNTSSGAWNNTVQQNRDIYVNNGAKPGYSKFTYPHPLRAGINGTPSQDPPVVTGNPQSFASTAGQGASFTVSVTGSSPLSYQWQKSQSNIPGATSATYTIAATQTADAGSYRCVITNPFGSATSSAATLTVNVPQPVPASVVTHPVSITRSVGQGAAFSVVAAGDAPLSYQWQKNGANIAGATGSTFTIQSAQLTDSGNYRCVVNNGSGTATSSAAVLTVNPPPPPDLTAPSIPGSLAANAVSSSQINLSWAASTDNSDGTGVTGYRVERGLGSSPSSFTQVGAPTGTSFSNSSLSPDTTYSYRIRAVDGAGNLSGYSGTVTATTPPVSSGPLPLPSGNSGIASQYPDDANITSHADVLFADAFESYSSAGQLSGNWSANYHGGNTRIATESANVFAGNRALEFTLPQTGSEVANAVVKNISPTQDILFVRTYTKFDSGFDVTGPGHNGIRISAGNYPGPGNPPNGSDFFVFSLENSIYYGEAEPGYTHVYVYHPEQRSQWGDHMYPDGKVLPFDGIPWDYGDGFVPRPNFIPQRNQWYCYELMVKANTPGQRDGRVAIWVDGAVIADFQNVRVRDVSSLKINQIQLELHAQGSSNRANRKWYDNVVVARSYIGPMAVVQKPSAPNNPRIITAGQ